MEKRAFVWLLIGTCFGAYAQQSKVHTVPRLNRADLPRYPPIAAAARVTGSLKVHITVINGNVVDAKVVSTEARDSNSHVWKNGSPLLTTPTLTYLKSWHFDSGVQDSFDVNFTYTIAGTETDLPTNPIVEILPSLDMTITARPIKPTVMY